MRLTMAFPTAIATIALLGFSFASQTANAAEKMADKTKPAEKTTAKKTGEKSKMTTVIIETSEGNIEVELNGEKAPISAANFLTYVDKKHYDGTIFHRVINGFMIQGGGFDEKMNQKPTGKGIENEAGNGLKNDRGTLAMARTSDPNSATAQFFINVADNAFLNFKNPSPSGIGYAVFGKVTAGMDVVDKIKDTATGNSMGMDDVPKKTMMIKTIRRK